MHSVGFLARSFEQVKKRLIDTSGKKR